NDLRGDQLRKIAQSGLLPLLYAHLFSLSVIREVFERQAQRGLLPAPELTI
ncbi:multidrug transporter, partial [Pseudomonas sp. FW305-130]